MQTLPQAAARFNMDAANTRFVTGAPQWATNAATSICELDGIRPHVFVAGDAGEMIGHIARLIADARKVGAA